MHNITKKKSIKTNTCFSLKQEAMHCGWAADNVSQWNVPQKAVSGKRSRIKDLAKLTNKC